MKASDFTYCPTCGVELPPSALIKLSKEVIKEEIANYFTGDLEPYTFEKVKYLVFEDLCPCCKKVLKRKEYLA